VVDRGGEHLDRLLAGLGMDLVERSVDDTLGDRLLAREHDDVHEFREFDVAELGIRENLAFGDFATTGHFSFLCVCSVEPSFLRGHGHPSEWPRTYRVGPKASAVAPPRPDCGRGRTKRGLFGFTAMMSGAAAPIRPSSDAWRRTWSEPACDP